MWRGYRIPVLVGKEWAFTRGSKSCSCGGVESRDISVVSLQMSKCR